jgi:hypothetical protein
MNLKWRYRVVEATGSLASTVNVGDILVDEVTVTPEPGEERQYDLLDTAAGEITGHVVAAAIGRYDG